VGLSGKVVMEIMDEVVGDSEGVAVEESTKSKRDVGDRELVESVWTSMSKVCSCAILLCDEKCRMGDMQRVYKVV
jgi:hypothetical protein